MFEATQLGEKVAAATNWRHLFAAVRAANEVNTSDGKGLYFSDWRICSPELAAARIHLIRDGYFNLTNITRNYGLRSKVSQRLNLDSDVVKS